MTSLKRLESFNAKCYKWICGPLPGYLSCLSQLNQLPLSYLLIYYDLTFLASLLHGKFDLNPLDYLQLSEDKGLRRTSSCLFNEKTCRKFRTGAAFFNRVAVSANFIFRHTELDVFGHQTAFKNGLWSYLVNRTKDNFNLSNQCTWHLVCKSPVQKLVFLNCCIHVPVLLFAFFKE
jgi:hypothetical protein